MTIRSYHYQISGFLGDCEAINQFLSTKPFFHPGWFLLNIINILCRSVGQVSHITHYLILFSTFIYLQTVFVNNPILGSFILLAIFLHNIENGLGCCLGGLVAISLELLLGLHPRDLLHSGLPTFNGALIGCVLPTIYSLLLPDSNQPLQLWLALLIGSSAR